MLVVNGGGVRRLCVAAYTRRQVFALVYIRVWRRGREGPSRRSGEASEKQRDQMVCTPGDGRDPPARICVSHPSFFPWQAKASCLLTHRVIPPPLRLCTWLHAETVVLLCSMPNLNSHSAGRMVSGRNRNGDAGERETEILEPCAINKRGALSM